MIRWIMIGSLCFLCACGTRPDQAKHDIELSQQTLQKAESTNCDHDSLALAQKSQKEADAYYKQGDYQKARVKAQLAKQYATEVIEHNRNYPCEVKPKDIEDVDDTAVNTEEDESVDSDMEDRKLATIYFGYDSSKLDQKSIQLLESHSQALRTNPEWHIRILGHCDQRGSTDYNLALSERRAVMVEGYLKKAGIDANRMTSVGYGSEMLATTRTDAAGHRLNRRVEFDIK